MPKAATTDATRAAHVEAINAKTERPLEATFFVTFARIV
jgi:hypothetical protein